MAMMLRRVARKTAKIGALGAGLGGSAKLLHMFINDDLDDFSYAVTSRYQRLGRDAAERKSVVVLGSGWGALSFVHKLDPEEYKVTVVSPRPFFFYTPLLVGSTTGVVSPGAIIEPVRDSAPECTFLRASCTDVDLESRKVFCEGGVSLDYDHLVVAVGAQPNTFGIPGVDKHGLFLKEMEHGREVRKRMLDLVDQADVAYAAGETDRVKQLLNFVVVGGGPTGVEFCGELSDFIKQNVRERYPKVAENIKVTLVEALPSLLTMFKDNVRSHVQEHLTNQGVDVRLNSMVKEVQERTVFLKTKEGVEEVDYGMLVWVAGVGMRPFTRRLCEQIGKGTQHKDGGQSDRRGLLVDASLRVKGTKPGEVFAIGDCAVSGKPPTAQVAYQQGKYLGRLFRLGNEHLIADTEAPGFDYNHQGSMAYVGEGKAAAELNPNSFVKLGRSPITDHLWWRALYGDEDQVRLLGVVGYAVWRSVYFSKLTSTRTRWSVASDWLRTALFGRPACSSSQGTLA